MAVRIQDCMGSHCRVISETSRGTGLGIIEFWRRFRKNQWSSLLWRWATEKNLRDGEIRVLARVIFLHVQGNGCRELNSCCLHLCIVFVCAYSICIHWDRAYAVLEGRRWPKRCFRFPEGGVQGIDHPGRSATSGQGIKKPPDRVPAVGVFWLAL